MPSPLNARRRREFVQFMVRNGVLMFGQFQTKSGRQSPYFINTGLYSGAAQLDTLGRLYAEAVESFFGGAVTNLFGPAYKAIPLVTATALCLHRDHNRQVTWTFDRKEAKDHGEGGKLVGHAYGNAPDKVVVLDDVTTAGTSVRRHVPGINAYPGTRVIGLVVSVDRLERGRGGANALRELEEEFELRAVSLVTLDDIQAYLEGESAAGGESAGLLENLRAYRAQYSA